MAQLVPVWVSNKGMHQKSHLSPSYPSFDLFITGVVGKAERRFEGRCWSWSCCLKVKGSFFMKHADFLFRFGWYSSTLQKHSKAFAFPCYQGFATVEPDVFYIRCPPCLVLIPRPFVPESTALTTGPSSGSLNTMTFWKSSIYSHRCFTHWPWQIFSSSEWKVSVNAVFTSLLRCSAGFRSGLQLDQSRATGTGLYLASFWSSCLCCWMIRQQNIFLKLVSAVVHLFLYLT